MTGSVIGASAPSAPLPGVEFGAAGGQYRAPWSRSVFRDYPPRYRAAKSGQLAGNRHPLRWSGGFSGKYPPRNRAANSGSQGRALSAPLSPLQKRPSVRNPLTPAIGGKNRGRLPRALSAPLLASLALRYRIISHNSARIRAVYIRTRQPRAPLHQGLEREHRGELHPRAGLHCVQEPGQRWHRSRGNYVRSGEVWPTSAPYRSHSRG